MIFFSFQLSKKMEFYARRGFIIESIFIDRNNDFQWKKIYTPLEDIDLPEFNLKKIFPLQLFLLSSGGVKIANYGALKSFS